MHFVLIFLPNKTAVTSNQSDVTAVLRTDY
ncbi:hypothetical protein LEGA110927_02160 [Leuconostoc gasicomitatum]